MAFLAQLTKKKTRIRIQSIDIDLSIPTEYPICLKLLLNDQVHQRLEEVAVGQALHWEKINPVDAMTTDIFELRAYEAHRLFRRIRIVDLKRRVDQLDHALPELKVEDFAGLVPCTVTFKFLTAEAASRAPHIAQQSAAAIAHLNPSVLENMGKTRDFVGSILKIGSHIAELNPIAKATLGLCKQAWETLEKQDRYDKLTVDLVASMGSMLPFIDEVNDQAKIASLTNTITQTLHLVEDASRFVVEYRSDGAAVRAVRAFTSGTAQEQVDEFIKRFDGLKEEFDRGLITQTILGVESLLVAAEREMLVKLMTPDADYDPSAGCLEGTRLNVLKNIQEWIDHHNTSQSFFWLFGVAGCGKSTISRSICKQLDEKGRLAGAFFCKRDSEHLTKPGNVLSTIAGRLAFHYPPYGIKLATVLRENPDLSTSSLKRQFEGMILHPFQNLDRQVGRATSIIVLDALDECGAVDTRCEILGYLHQWSQLVPWLKVILTSRPNEEIARVFKSKGDTVQQHDLFSEDSQSVFEDIAAFIRFRLERFLDDNEELAPRTWLHDDTTPKLAAKANGLFIWAQTSCSVICNSVDPDDKIHGLLNGESSEDAKKQLSLLYTTVLDQALGDSANDVEIIKSCISAILFTVIPLNDMSLSHLLIGQVNLDTFRLVIRRLASVVYRDQHGAIRVIHKSFTDYMVEECPVRYRVKRDEENLKLSVACMKIMVDELKFNICELQDSKLYNRDLHGLEIRIKDKVRPHLEYSCLYWMEQLGSTPLRKVDAQRRQEIMQLLEALLLHPRALYWIEVLSLFGKLREGEDMLYELWRWMRGRNEEISDQAADLQSFMNAFYHPISRSTPHLYVSAIALGARTYEGIRLFEAQFPNIIQLAPRVQAIEPSKPPRHTTIRYLGYLRDYSHSGWLNDAAGSQIAFSPDNQQIALGSGDRGVRLWDALTGTYLAELGRRYERVTSIAFSSSGQKIASGSDDGTIKLWDTHTHKALHSFTGHARAVSCVSLSSKDRYIVSGSRDNSIRLWDARSNSTRFKPFRGHSLGVTSVKFSYDSRSIVSGSKDDTVRLWDVETQSLVFEPLQKHTGVVRSVAFSSDNMHIASGSKDMTVQLWDARVGTAVLSFSGHTRGVNSITFAPNGQQIASGSSDKTVRLWDLRTGTSISSMVGHAGKVISTSFSVDGMNIASASGDGTIRVWGVSNSTIPASDLPPDFPSSQTPGPYVTNVQLAKLLSRDGWVRDNNGELLFWLPSYYRRYGLDRSLSIITIAPATDLNDPSPPNHLVSFDLTNFKYGTKWTETFAPGSRYE